jgi:uncharacterized damage-inducible protein DinB
MPTTTRERTKTETTADDEAKPRKAKAKRRAKPPAEEVVEASSDEPADETPKRKAKSKSAKAGKRAARTSDAPSESGESGAAPTGSAARTSGASGASRTPGATRTSAAAASKVASRSAASKGTSRSSTKSAGKAKSAGKERAPIDLASAVLQALATNERMNQFLLEHLDDRAWTLPPLAGHGRTIAAIVSHMHNVRHMWLQVTSKGTTIPEKLDRQRCTKPEAMNALAKSGQALLALFERALESGGRVKDFRPDVVGFLGYVTAHEAHHRGQICLLAREHGLPISNETNFGLWDWNKRWKECGY